LFSFPPHVVKDGIFENASCGHFWPERRAIRPLSVSAPQPRTAARHSLHQSVTAPVTNCTSQLLSTWLTLPVIDCTSHLQHQSVTAPVTDCTSR
jgi:hypothetical protein